MKGFRVNRWRFDDVDGVGYIQGEDVFGITIKRQCIEFNLIDVDTLILGLQKLKAGPLGRMAIDQEAGGKP
jgi:hypothetical protein